MKNLILKFCLSLFLIISPGSYAQLELVNAFPDISFSNPVDLQSPGDGSDRIFVIEQNGFIVVFPNVQDITSFKIFLDIRDRVDNGGEMGLLGLAFHPDFENNGYFFVNYTNNDPSRRTVISRFQVSISNPDSADDNSELILLTQNQPYQNHNGGQIAFGPDGYLYIALGDGGSGGDPDNNGQNPRTLLGSILRIDVNSSQGDLNYSIPLDNPFTGNTEGFREEIYAYGLRNPWRFSFDPATGTLWCADVGQSNWEEIDTIRNGGNYGWNIMEGNHCYSSSNCDTSALILPVWEYENNGNCSVTGGYVYRGNSVPELEGKYIYADYCTANIWSLDVNGDSAVNEFLLESPSSITSFGTDENNELYICTESGDILKFSPTATGINDNISQPEDYILLQNYPNPFNPATRIKYKLPERSEIKIVITDMLGRVIDLIDENVKPAGNYEVNWNAENRSSGIYYARLTAKSASGKIYNQTVKMVYLK